MGLGGDAVPRALNWQVGIWAPSPLLAASMLMWLLPTYQTASTTS